jgi:hypothetical protein
MANTYKTKGSFSSEIQPGWTIEDDGFGLLTSRVVYINDSDKATGGPAKLSAHPYNERLQCHKVSYTINSAKRSVATADYVGISSGSYTPIDFRADYSSASLSIGSHPGFSVKKYSATKALIDCGWANGKFDETNADAIANGLVGVKNYVAGEMSVSGTFYTSSKEWLQKWVDGVGKTIDALPGDSGVVLPSKFEPISAKHTKKGLLTNVSYEQYAHLYKVSFTVRVATGMWNTAIYDAASTT